MFLRIIVFVIGLVMAPAYADSSVGAQLPTVYANMLDEFSDRSITNDERYGRLKEHYAAAAETISNTAVAADESLGAAFSMGEAMLTVELGYSKALPQRYVADMSSAFKELSRRGAASTEQRNSMIGAYLSIWQVDAAKALTTDETRIKERDIVAFKRVGAFDPKAPAVVLVSGADGTAQAMPFEFAKGPAIVVSAGCHIARRAAEAISADPRLSAAFLETNVLWLSPASTAIDPVELDKWNSRFPNSKMHVAFDNSEWQGIDFARLPSFHFYLDGKLVTRINGWSEDKAALEQLWAALGAIGINAVPEINGTEINGGGGN